MKGKLKNKKVVYTIIGIISVLLVVAGITYAYWLVTRTQQGTNVISSGCLDIDLVGVNDITLSNEFPMSDEDGAKLTPYEFTVTNNCNTAVDYQIALEAFDVENKEEIAASSLKVALNEKGDLNIFSDLLSAKSLTPTTLVNTLESRVLKYSTLMESGSEESSDTYEFRIWIDKDAPISEMNKIFKSKIVVTVGQNVGFDIWDGISTTAFAELDIDEELQMVNVNSAADLAGVRDAVNTGQLKNYTFNINTNIDLNNKNWEPIGDDGVGDHNNYDYNGHYFSGTINGNNHIISNLNVNSVDEGGFIKAVDGVTTVRDLTIDGGSVSADGSTAGGLIAYVIGYGKSDFYTVTIKNVEVNVNVKGTSTAGGIIGRAYHHGDTIIEKSVNRGNVEGPSSNSGKVSGILGYYLAHVTWIDRLGNTITDNKVMIYDCENYGTISNGKQTGGILSLVNPDGGGLEIRGSINYGTIKNSQYAGGIIGMIDRDNVIGYVKWCENYGSVTADYQAGGLIGQMYSIKLAVTDCVNNGNINVNINAEFENGNGEVNSNNPIAAGGLYGVMGGYSYQQQGEYIVATKCVNNGNVSGHGYLGGIAGHAHNYTILDDCTNNVSNLSNVGHSINFVTLNS